MGYDSCRAKKKKKLRKAVNRMQVLVYMPDIYKNDFSNDWTGACSRESSACKGKDWEVDGEETGSWGCSDCDAG